MSRSEIVRNLLPLLQERPGRTKKPKPRRRRVYGGNQSEGNYVEVVRCLRCITGLTANSKKVCTRCLNEGKRQTQVQS